MIGGILGKLCKGFAALMAFSYLRDKFCRQPKAIQLIIKGILAFIPSGLIGIAVHAKYMSWLKNTATLSKPAEYLIVLIIFLFWVIIFVACYLIIHIVLTWSGPIAKSKDGFKKTCDIAVLGGKKMKQGATKVSTGIKSGAVTIGKFVGPGKEKLKKRTTKVFTGIKTGAINTGKFTLLSGKKLKQGTLKTLIGSKNAGQFIVGKIVSRKRKVSEQRKIKPQKKIERKEPSPQVDTVEI